MIAVWLVAASAFGGDKKPPLRSTENDILEITATVIADREAVKQAIGSDLGGHYILVDVHLTPKDGQKIKINLDDFLLRTDKDGERTTPFAPSQIAGSATMVLTQGAANSGGHWASPGNPELGPYGPPIMNGGAIGGGSDVPGETRATIKQGSKDKTDPILEVLKEKVLPEKETEAPASGLLYFPMEKQKIKDLELIYKTPDGKLSLRFK